MSATEAAENSVAPVLSVGHSSAGPAEIQRGGPKPYARSPTWLAVTAPDAIAVLIRSMSSKNQRVGLAAAIELLNRAYGRAPPTLGVGDEVMSLS